MALFLSYADEDAGIAAKITARLHKEGFKLYDWKEPRNRGGRFIKRIEDQINKAEAFLALASTHYFTSEWCQREYEIALQREVSAADAMNRMDFIRVLQVGAIPTTAPYGFLSGYDRLPFTTDHEIDESLPVLVSLLRGGSSRGTARRAPSRLPTDPTEFRNRTDELEALVRGLRNTAGPHFWLVVAPPKLGKSWLLHRLSEILSATPPGARTDGERYLTRLVDLRVERPALRSDTSLLIAKMFDLPLPRPVGKDLYRDAARQIVRGRRPYLCLLDSADLLSPATVREVRSCIGEILERLQSMGSPVRLALVVSSRRQDYWNAVAPGPRLSSLQLSEFSDGVIQHALGELATRMQRTFSPPEMKRHAARVHAFTEGLPALLMRCLNWIEQEEWIDLHRMAEDTDLFNEINGPYITNELLSVDNLAPAAGPRGRQVRYAIDEAFRVLVPYRLFTRSHIMHHLEQDDPLRAAVAASGLSWDELWNAVGRTSLLQPVNELWRVTYPAIRRLLYRHHYPTHAERLRAHEQARAFVEVWMEQQAGTECVAGMVECLWHEAVQHRLRDGLANHETLVESARSLSARLKPSNAYTVEDLRLSAGERLRRDYEFHDVVSAVPGLFERLVAVVAQETGGVE